MSTPYQFANPEWLYALIPVVLLLLLRKKRGAEGSIAHPTLHFIAPLLRTPQSLAGRIGSVLLVLGTLLLVLALAKPQHVNEKEFRTVSGIDIMIAFDLSGSMSTEDMYIQHNRTQRLVAAQWVIMNFISQRPNDRIGVVGFAAKSKTFAPLTLDHQLVNKIVESFNLEMIHHDGTAIGTAIAAAASRLEDRKETKSKIIILVTDGASNSGLLAPIPAAEAAAKLGIKIYTIAIGTEDGTVGRGVMASNNFDEPTLREIAKITGGEHFRARDTDKLFNAFTSIDQLEKSEAKSYTVRKVKDFFPWFLGSAGILIMFGLSLQAFRPTPAP